MDASKNRPITHAVLIDPGRKEGLAELLEDCPVALLPVGAKPLLQHWMEHLAATGVQDVLLLLSHMPEKTCEFVGSGERWGMKVDTALVHEDARLKKQLSHGRVFIHEYTFVADINILPIQGFNTWLEQIRPERKHYIVGLPEKNQAFLQLLDEGCFREAHDGGPLTVETPAGSEDTYRYVHNALDLWQANMDILSGVITDSHPVGFETEAGVFKNRNCRVHKTCKVERACIIGENSLLGQRAHIGPDVVLGANVIVDSRSHITNSVVFDHTFIGSHTEVSGAIAAGRLLLKVDSGVATYINDPAILSETRQAPRRGRWRQRFTALALMALLGLPLLMRSLWLRLRGKKAWQRESLYLDAGRSLSGERELEQLSVCSLAVEHPAWRKLPWLWHAVRGELALTGISPRMSENTTLPEWASDALSLPEGVITLADVTGADQASEEAAIADSYYQAVGGSDCDLALLWRWFLLFWKSGADRSHRE